ncbi:MAG: hypothetical protein QTN59_01650 [Candidatus Electrothrix communis]|nr:hypothetical protein [Desulfobulbus sp. US4]WLE97546.1 MAG: hypothetical protein QTN59_01650 [Candidatus Electrothrix communis]
MENKQKNSSSDNQIKASCHYCGATVGESSQRTEETVTAMYDCEKCNVNYCDQCSYEKVIDGHAKQFCLRCESEIEKLM